MRVKGHRHLLAGRKRRMFGSCQNSNIAARNFYRGRADLGYGALEAVKTRQRRNEACRRCLKQTRGCAVRPHLAGFHDQHVPRQVRNVERIMGHKQRGAVCAGRVQEAAPPLGRFHVDCGQGLVHNQHRRPCGQRAHQRHVGGLAAGEGGNGDVGKLVQSRCRQELLRTYLIAGDHGHRLHSRRARRQPRPLGEQDDVGALWGDLPAAQTPSNAPHERGFTGAVWAHYGCNGAWGKVRAHPIDLHGDGRNLSGSGELAQLVGVEGVQLPRPRLVVPPPQDRQACQRQAG